MTIIPLTFGEWQNAGPSHYVPSFEWADEDIRPLPLDGRDIEPPSNMCAADELAEYYRFEIMRLMDIRTNERMTCTDRDLIGEMIMWAGYSLALVIPRLTAPF